jgi:hypothetical protein
MTPELPDPEFPARMARLVDALDILRDALVKASLLMQDFRFEIESEQDSQVAEHSRELIKKVKAR